MNAASPAGSAVGASCSCGRRNNAFSPQSRVCPDECAAASVSGEMDQMKISSETGDNLDGDFRGTVYITIAVERGDFPLKRYYIGFRFKICHIP